MTQLSLFANFFVQIDRSRGFIGAVRFAEKTSWNNTILADFFKRKILLQLKRQVEKDTHTANCLSLAYIYFCRSAASGVFSITVLLTRKLWYVARVIRCYFNCTALYYCCSRWAGPTLNSNVQDFLYLYSFWDGSGTFNIRTMVHI
jgi:hypothetical protein